MDRVIEKNKHKNKAKKLFILGGVLILSAYISIPLIFVTFGLSVIITMLLLVSGGVCILLGVGNLLKSNTHKPGSAAKTRPERTLSNRSYKYFYQRNGSKYSNNSYATNCSMLNNDHMNEQAIQNMHRQMVEQQTMQQQAVNRHIQQAMNEGIRAATPFDLGGYVQGPGFNPSETMAHTNMMNQMF